MSAKNETNPLLTNGKRHLKLKPQRGISKKSITRLARRGGIARMSSTIHKEAVSIIDYFINKVMHDAVAVSRTYGRKTIFLKDINYALDNQNRKLYGS